MESDIMRLRQYGHCPCLYLSEPKQQWNFKLFCLICVVCAVEDSARCSLKINKPRTFYINQQGMAYCDQCTLPSHSTMTNTSIRKVEDCEYLTCFEIIHMQSNEDLWYKYEDNGVGRRRMWTYHPFFRAVKVLLKEQLPSQSSSISYTRWWR